ncbi:hypothetical protein GO986_21950 [Deinococcus sp. HMF7620]|uniref:Uncharacterized protein n=1 Tax=Deinococcus arboris TaxID=2682977 RepID=A0A7C9LXR9_9DEIO|nr:MULTISPECIES: hypothetical protein [Deinococcus]MBZ9752833.1 hypothetical protein [Deinococcus betulae]MVN89400.1 hypothetical protein [Deinococcus arboris]
MAPSAPHPAPPPDVSILGDSPGPSLFLLVERAAAGEPQAWLTLTLPLLLAIVLVMWIRMSNRPELDNVPEREED